ncbi:DUF4369 domain-containing protein [Flavobacterium amniphilum]|uniref:DUF4369 domain-containing protein n=1 Tax=Flavobacterium amniphilum TaxID=1834035 RepID=UPI002029F91B|nr:DUF4369 domain-containing protein [Flavobacterium amniphilum]MCL9807014.1 DUF4369 domain-containing protein [Flavobacterium amniphilum]
MKKLAIIALSALAVSCNKYKVSGEVKGLPDGTMVYLEKQNESAATGIAGVDTTTVKDGKFEFKGKAEEPLMHRVRFDQLGGFMFILEKGDINVKAQKDSLMMGLANISGSRTNDELAAYKKSLIPIQNKAMEFGKQNDQPYKDAAAKKDSVTMKKIADSYKKIDDEFQSHRASYVEKNKDSFLSLLIIQEMFGSSDADITKIKKYFDNLSSDLKETSTGKKIKTYIEKIEKANPAAPKKKLS